MSAVPPRRESSLANTEYDEQLGDFGDNETTHGGQQAGGRRAGGAGDRLPDALDDHKGAPQRLGRRAAASESGAEPPRPVGACESGGPRRTLQPEPQSQRSRTPSASGGSPTAGPAVGRAHSRRRLPHESLATEPTGATRVSASGALAARNSLTAPLVSRALRRAAPLSADDQSDQNLSRAVSLLDKVLVRPPLTALLVYRTALLCRWCVYKANVCRLVESVPRSQVNICSFSFTRCRAIELLAIYSIIPELRSQCMRR